MRSSYGFLHHFPAMNGMCAASQKLIILMKSIKISPSILAADFGQLNNEIALIEAHRDELHLDVMDGQFVPNITIGPVVLSALKTELPFDVHLMIVNPEEHITAFAAAGASNISFHIEATQRARDVIDAIRRNNCSVGIAINPDTPVSDILDYIADVDRILVMSVYPGFAGQKFIDDVLVKVRELRLLTKKDIQIDGGINVANIKKAIDSGANIIVAASAIF